MHLILASASPRRRELLRSAGFDFEVRPASLDETPRAGEAPEGLARRIAREKALDVAAGSRPGSIVLGADTVVENDGMLLGKPADPEDAARMLHLLSGTTHRVVTGICLVRAPDVVAALEHATTKVTFRPLTEAEIRDYIASGEPFDKAGAYGIQGLASKFVSSVEGDYSNVVGLPVGLVRGLLKPLLKPQPPDHSPEGRKSSSG